MEWVLITANLVMTILTIIILLEQRFTIQNYSKQNQKFTDSAAEEFSNLANLINNLAKDLDRIEHKQSDLSQAARMEFSSQFHNFSKLVLDQMHFNFQNMDAKLRDLQHSNQVKLEEMRQTVDEKLQSTLDRRLTESFKVVSDRLELVTKGLGEMQTLASGVGDLKRVLSNVKTRGVLGELQLGLMLEQVLAPEQYDKNVATGGANERVEFAIKLPGNRDSTEPQIWLPIDAKYPLEDYQRILDARDKGNIAELDVAQKNLTKQIELWGKAVSEKYIHVPLTTDFAIIYLPTEGLFAEVIQNTQLMEKLRNSFHVMVAGPTTLWSLLNSLLIGFKTLAIEKRSSEVWLLLASIKTQWQKYDKTLTLVQKKLLEATDSLDKVQVRTRAIDRRLNQVQELNTGSKFDGELPSADEFLA